MSWQDEHEIAGEIAIVNCVVFSGILPVNSGLWVLRWGIGANMLKIITIMPLICGSFQSRELHVDSPEHISTVIIVTLAHHQCFNT